MFNGIDKLLFILEEGGKKYDIDKISEAYEYAKGGRIHSPSDSSC